VFLDLSVNGGKIEVQLARIFRLERCHFQFDDDIATQREVVEKQIDKKLVTAYSQPVLAPNEREPRAKLQQKLCDVPGQCTLDVALLSVLRQRQEFKYVRILQRFACKVGLRRRQAFGKIRDRIAGTATCIRFDLCDENGGPNV